MKKNPLTTTVIVFAIGDAYTVWDAITKGEVSPFEVAAWFQGIVLFVLYLKNLNGPAVICFTRSFRSFRFTSRSKFIELNPPPATSEFYIVASLIYVLAMALLWKQKRDYDQYIEAERAPALPV
jgi:hypothetical protein